MSTIIVCEIKNSSGRFRLRADHFGELFRIASGRRQELLIRIRSVAHGYHAAFAFRFRQSRATHDAGILPRIISAVKYFLLLTSKDREGTVHPRREKSGRG